MRAKDILKLIQEYSIFMKYLYLDKEHTITYNNGITNLKLTMNDNLEVYAENESFSNTTPLYYSSELTLSNVLRIINKLKQQKPEQYNSFNNRWEEIKNITMTNLLLNYK